MTPFNVDGSIISEEILYFSSFDNKTLNFLPFYYSWIFPFFIFCLVGFLFSMLTLFTFVYFSMNLERDLAILPNFFICFSVHLIYLISLICFLRGNDFFCGLREFLIQFAYVCLFSSLIAEYFDIRLNKRIDLKRTRQCLTILFFALLISIQIPIGILWWNFTRPQTCQEQFTNSSSIVSVCSYQCLINDQFYATLTYIIIELIVCTIFASILFLSTNKYQTIDQTSYTIFIEKYQRRKNTLRFSTLFLVDFVWTFWSIFYHLTDRFFLFPTLIFGLFTIGTLCFTLIVIPQVYFYFKICSFQQRREKSILFKNQFDVDDQWKYCTRKTNPRSTVVSFHRATDDNQNGTFLPITRTPRAFSRSTLRTNRTNTLDKLNRLIYGQTTTVTPHNVYENRVNQSQETFDNRQKTSPLTKGHSTSSSGTSELIHTQQSTVNSRFSSNRRDETIIPIICGSERCETSTPVKMRILLKRCSSSTTHAGRFYMQTDPADLRRPYFYFLSSSARNSSQSSSCRPSTYIYGDPYQMRSTQWQTILTRSSDHVRKDYRLLSERLWDMESDEEQTETIIEHRQTSNHFVMTNPDRLHVYPSEYDDQSIRHIDDDDEDDDDIGYDRNNEQISCRL